MQNKINKQRGYTIIETMISVSLFSIVISVGMGTLLNANLLHKKSESMRSITDNLSFIMEDMSRNLRTGYNYRCITANPPDLDSANVAIPKSGSNCWGIAFEYAAGDNVTTDGDPIDNNDQWVYYMGPDTSVPGNPIGVWKSTQGPYGTSSFIKLTPSEVIINPISGFSVLGSEAPPGNTQQPFVIIKLVGTITFKNVVTPFSLQTSVSQRLIDI